MCIKIKFDNKVLRKIILIKSRISALQFLEEIKAIRI